MTLENAKVLYKHFLAINNEEAAAQQLKRYPELAEKPKIVEAKKSGKK